MKEVVLQQVIIQVSPKCCKATLTQQVCFQTWYQPETIGSHCFFFCKCSPQRDYIIRAARTPPKEEQKEGNTSPSKLDSIDEEWFTAHASQVVQSEFLKGWEKQKGGGMYGNYHRFCNLQPFFQKKYTFLFTL